MKNIAIIDYGMGNLDSVLRAVEENGGNSFFTNNPKELDTATHIILPGVGSFFQGIRNIRELGLENGIKKQVFENKIPFLGICLGMQLMATKGSEGGFSEGLNLIEGEVDLLPADNENKIPHIGWNEVHLKNDSLLFKGIENGKDFYFVHSFHFKCKNEENIAGTTPYCGSFTSFIKKDNIFGVQFHPEKSQKNGFKIIKNFLEL